jgi:hypothetical protein
MISGANGDGEKRRANGIARLLRTQDRRGRVAGLVARTAFAAIYVLPGGTSLLVGFIAARDTRARQGGST